MNPDSLVVIILALIVATAAGTLLIIFLPEVSSRTESIVTQDRMPLSDEQVNWIAISCAKTMGMQPLDQNGMMNVYYNRYCHENGSSHATRTVNATEVKLDTGLDIGKNKTDYEIYVKWIEDIDAQKAARIANEIQHHHLTTLDMSLEDSNEYSNGRHCCNNSTDVVTFDYIQVRSHKHCTIIESVDVEVNGWHYKTDLRCDENPTFNKTS